jgi:hypothetical protein
MNSLKLDHAAIKACSSFEAQVESGKQRAGGHNHIVPQ